MLRAQSPIARFVVFILVTLAALLSAALGTINYLAERARLRTELRTYTEVQAEQLAASLALPVWNFDQPQLSKIFESSLHDPKVAAILVRINDVSSPGGYRTEAFARDDAGNIRPMNSTELAPPGLMEERPLLVNGEKVGSSALYVTARYMDEALRYNLVYQTLTFIAFCLILSASLYFLLWRTVLRPLLLIERYASDVSSGASVAPASGPFRGELHRLRNSIQSMVQLLAARYASLRQNLHFEELMARITSRLIGTNPDNLNAILSESLSDIGDLLGADRVILGQTRSDVREMDTRAYFLRAGPPVKTTLDLARYCPTLWRNLVEDRATRFSDVLTLDGDNAADRAYLESIGIRSMIAAPVHVAGLHFFLAAGGVEPRPHWSDEDIARIRVLAEVLATTVLRCEAETALRLTQYAVDHNPVMIFRIDMDGRFVYANDAACGHFGYAPADMLRLHLWDIAETITPDNWQERAERFRQERSLSIESVYTTRDGTRFPAEIRVQYVEFSGRRHFFVFAFDITTRKSAQQAEHAYTRRVQKLATELTRSEERQRRELAATLHDGVGQNLFAATTQLLTARSRSQGDAPEIDAALGLLDSVTKETRELTYQLCPPALYQLGLMPALLRLADQFIARYGIACSVSGNTPGPADLNARGLAYQAVRELLNNIAKHAHATHVAISAAETDGRLVIDMSDDGVGFDLAQLAARAPYTASPSGGFGLFHLTERVELLGGSLRIDSAPGRGCRVQLTLPLKVLQFAE